MLKPPRGQHGQSSPHPVLFVFERSSTDVYEVFQQCLGNGYRPEIILDRRSRQSGARAVRLDRRTSRPRFASAVVIRVCQGRARTVVLIEALPPAALVPADLGLTRRETEVLGWVAEGKTNPDIGAILDISRRTVQEHLNRIYRKLGVETRTAAAAHALRITSVVPAGSESNQQTVGTAAGARVGARGQQSLGVPR